MGVRREAEPRKRVERAVHGRIWQKHFPATAPTEGIDYAFLARQFKLTGGNIRSICLAAAFEAAREGTSITMSHVVPALEAEYQKQGRLLLAGELGEHMRYARRGASR